MATPGRTPGHARIARRAGGRAARRRRGRRAVRVRGAGTKLGWGGPAGFEPELELSHRGARRDRGAQRRRPDRGPRGRHAAGARRRASSPRRARCSRSTRPTAAATVGGVVATGDSGPLRHRYGGVRDLVLGVHVALSDGTVAQDRRQGDQERGRLRPGQAVRRLVRHARRDPRGGRAPAPAPAVHRHGGRPHRRRRDAGRGGGRARPRAARAQRARRALGGRRRARCSPASAAPRRGRQARERGRGCCARPALEADLPRTTTGCWAAQRDGQRARRPATRSCACPACRRSCRRCSRRPRATGARLVGRAAARSVLAHAARTGDRRGAAVQDLRAAAPAPRGAGRARRGARAGSTPGATRRGAVLELMRRVKDALRPRRRLQPRRVVGGL